MTTHVVPRNDTYPHADSVTCACGPTIEAVPSGWMVVHNSWDGREYREVRLGDDPLAQIPDDEFFHA